MRVIPHVVPRVTSLARIDDDSSYCTRDDRDSAVQPTKRDCTEGGSSDYILDELGTLFFQGRPVVPNYNNMNNLEGD